VNAEYIKSTNAMITTMMATMFFDIGLDTDKGNVSTAEYVCNEQVDWVYVSVFA
jgi:hypothetical protein